MKKLISKKMLVTIGTAIAVIAGNHLGVPSELLKWLVLLSAGYVGTEFSLDLSAIFKGIKKDGPGQSPGN